MALFRKGPSPHEAALAMIGVKSGDRVLVAGLPDPELVARIARVTGLSGQTVVAADAAARPALEDAAAKEGVLVEILEMTGPGLPGADGTHDIVALHVELAGLAESAHHALAASAVSAARPGGRIILVEGRRRTGFFSRPAPTTPGEVVVTILGRAGALAARALGTIDGVAYFEGRKPRASTSEGD